MTAPHDRQVLAMMIQFAMTRGCDFDTAVAGVRTTFQRAQDASRAHGMAEVTAEPYASLFAALDAIQAAGSIDPQASPSPEKE